MIQLFIHYLLERSKIQINRLPAKCYLRPHKNGFSYPPLGHITLSVIRYLQLFPNAPEPRPIQKQERWPFPQTDAAHI